MHRLLTIALVAIALVGCQSKKAGVTKSQVPNLDREKMERVVGNNMFLYPGEVTEDNYTAEACTTKTNKGCYRTGVMLNERTVVIPKHQFMQGPYQDITMNKNGEWNSEMVNFRRDMEYIAIGGVQASSNAAVELEFAQPDNVQDSRVVIAFYDGDIKRVGTRAGVVVGDVEGKNDTPLLKIQTEHQKGDVGAAVFTEQAELVGMIVNAPNQPDQEGYRYAVPTPHILKKLEEVAFF